MYGVFGSLGPSVHQHQPTTVLRNPAGKRHCGFTSQQCVPLLTSYPFVWCCASLGERGQKKRQKSSSNIEIEIQKLINTNKKSGKKNTRKTPRKKGRRKPHFDRLASLGRARRSRSHVCVIVVVFVEEPHHHHHPLQLTPPTITTPCLA